MYTIRKDYLRPTIIVSLVLSMTFFFAAFCFASDRKDTGSLKSLVSEATGTLNSFKFLGIARLNCNDCSYIMLSEDERYWNFSSEPKIVRVDPDGPANGKLKKGDRIVAIDGVLITTRRAGERLAEIAPGDQVELTVRRNGRTVTETILAEEPASKNEFELETPDNALTIRVGKLSKELESLARYAAELARGSTEIPAPPEIPRLDGLGDIDEPVDISELGDLAEIIENLRGDFLPRGWFGIALSFGGSISRQKDGPSQWRFERSPQITSVEADSPADRAGLMAGDVITHIDGAKLTSDRGGERFSDIEPGQTVTWTIKRGREKFDVEMKAVERPAKTPSLLPYGRAASRHKLRYTGSLGNTDIEVEGDDSVEVTADKEAGFIVIKSRGATVRIRLSGDKD